MCFDHLLANGSGTGALLWQQRRCEAVTIDSTMSRHSFCGFGTMWAGRRHGTPSEDS
ncbi:hypothetical protein EMIHUDRAFT_356726 [Emiliania huxleyi CCMP1516]|uniref:Uncharacterized protein n=2 Tax=Emiliania huxleyi TaxID=2903 RepID=A0A0D3IS49_EMIH1|nr:hypothetical protein EMIHUDRAFT_356726 [Emiliania huxleyi CCMP1516]EOD14084.1 hypothetical protein EMIHUDRAFT_356726 [Emiliania huxleyi CCMP1516]|eukprot:XP_005766513.1 hypothetical protein EMIHUDRAFT_356726 [Emiliania huxleyi CCMP1516]